MKINSKLRKFLSAALLMLVAQTTSAQQMQASLSHYSTDNGLTSNAVSCITQDDYGYIWLATWNGLSRFDGYNFYNYQTGNGSRIPNLHNRIRFITIDNLQNVWMNMYDGRVFVMKRNIDQIVNPFKNISGNEEFRTTFPVVVTTSGDVLASIEGVGLYKLRMERDDNVNAQLITTGGLTITSMAEGYQNDIWLGTDQGVHRMDIANLTIEKKGKFLDEYITCLFSNGYNIFAGTKTGRIMSFAYGQEPQIIRSTGTSAINALFIDSHGLIWFTDSRMGAMCLNPQTGVERVFTQNVVVPDHDGQGGVFRETEGVVWMRMNHGGYGYYNRQTDEVEYFHNDPSNPWNLSNSVNASLELGEGVIWESTSRRGLEKLEILKNTIVREKLMPESSMSIDNETRAMYYDQQRKLLLIGNKNGRLFVIKDNGERTVITQNSKGEPIGRSYGIMKDTKGNYWLSSKDNGITKMTPNGSGWTLTNYCHSDDDEYSLSSNSAYSTVEDEDGNIWVATYGGCVNVMTKDKNGHDIFIHPKNRMKGYPFNSYNKVRCVALGPDGKVWAGTTDGILIMSLDKQKKTVSIERMLSSEVDPDHILMSNDVVCIGRDRMNTMWIGTNGGGLGHTIGRDSKGRWLFENFGAKDGLPSEEIRSLTFDNRNNVWFSTDHVLCSFDTNKGIFTTFSSLDGVDETMCSEGAAITLPNGNILFGTVDGYYVVDRKKLTSTMGNMLKLRITDFYLNEQLQSPRLGSIYDYYVPDSRSVKLPSHNSSFSMRFASLNYQLQHRMHYQYMLEGYDREWQNANRERTVHYANLPTGTYHFKVKAFLLESPEKYDMKVIEVEVPPYFLFSANAIWLYMVVAAVLGIWLLLWREKYLTRREKLRQLREDKSIYNINSEADYAFLKQQSEWLEANYANPSQGAQQMAEAMQMDSDELAARVRQLTGQSPQEFITDFRLKKAFMLLENTEQGLTDIAFATGFGDVTAFNRLFKEKTGLLPSKYREDHKEAKAQEAKKKQEEDDDIIDDYEIIED